MTLRLILAACCVIAIFALVVPFVLRLAVGPRSRSGFEYFWTTLAVAPPYVLGVVVLVLFAGSFGWVSAIFEPSRLVSWILPSIVLAAYPTAVVLRLFDQQLTNVLKAPYVLCARAIGFPLHTILLRQALPNAAPTALAALANGLAFFVTGTFFVEVIFGISGLGRLTYEAISDKDVVLLASICVVFAVAITVVTTVLDLALVLLDPRLRARSV